MQKIILIICSNNNLAKSPRFLMEVSALKDSYKLIAAGTLCDPLEKEFEFVDLTKIVRIRKHYYTFHHKYPFLIKKAITFFIRLLLYRSIYYSRNFVELRFNHYFNLLNKLKFDLIIVHHFNDLPLAVKLAKEKNIRTVLNAHEYYPLEFDADEHWMQTTHLQYMAIARTYLKQVDICFCVAPKIAEKYREEFSLKSIVITNAKPWCDLKPALLQQNEKIKLIHHGAAIPARKIELMIELMSFLDDTYTLDFVLTGDQDYINKLKMLAKPFSNIVFLDPVKTKEISFLINKYDIGVFLLETSNFNYKFALPNKLFEFIQARLAIAIAPSPEMAAVVNQYDLGVVADDFTPQALANKIKSMSTKKIMYYKNQSHRYAKELSDENNEILIKNTIDKLTNNS